MNYERTHYLIKIHLQAHSQDDEDRAPGTDEASGSVLLALSILFRDSSTQCDEKF